MDRVLKAPLPSKPLKAVKAPKAEGFRFLIPGASAWELWTRTASGAVERTGEVDPAVVENRWSAASFLAVPLQHTVVIPLWLATTDRSLMSGMVWLQLERKGLLSGSREQTAMDYRVVREESGRSLLSVLVLSEHFPEDQLCPKGLFRYHPAADCFDLPANQLLLWKELGHLILAFTSGTEIVYAQCFRTGVVDQGLAQEALCALWQLQSEQILSDCSGITAWGSFSRQELDLLSQTIGVTVAVQNMPSPQIPASLRNLTPYSVRVLQQGREKGARLRRLGMVGGLLYFLVLAAVLGQLGWLLWQKKTIEQDLALHREEVQTIRDTAGRWEAMELAIMPETYPLEMLFRCTRQLPEEGLRLVTFDQSGTKVLMTGEAKSSAAAFQFLQDLKKSPDLAGYQWEMPPPKLLPSDAAQFQIEGKRSYAPVDSQ